VEVTIRARVRLLDCWAPELNQPGGPEAKAYLVKLANGKRAIMNVPIGARLDDSFSFGRVLSWLNIDGVDVSKSVVDAGHATAKKQKPGAD